MSVFMKGRAYSLLQGSSFEDLRRVSLAVRDSSPEQERRWQRAAVSARECVKPEIASARSMEVCTADLGSCAIRQFDLAVRRAVREVFHRELNGVCLRVGPLRTSPALAALTVGDTLYVDERAMQGDPLAVAVLLGRALAYHWQQQDGRSGAQRPGSDSYLVRDPALDLEADVYAWLLAARLSKPKLSSSQLRLVAPEIAIDVPDNVPPVARRVTDGSRVTWILEAPKEVARGGSTRVGKRGTGRGNGRGKGRGRIAKGTSYRVQKTGPLSLKLVKVIKAVRQRTRFEVSEITFGGGNLPIEYARIPNQNLFAVGETYVRTGQYAPRQHVAPVAVLPAVGQPHWMTALQNGRAVSWPVAYVQGAVGATLTASFTASGNFTGPKWIHATSNAGVHTDIVQVNFVAGIANAVVFQLTIPAGQARRLNALALNWEIGDANPPNQAMATSTHTLFLVHAAPLATRGEQLFEIFDWACGWADQVAGAANIVTAIWNQFSPVQNNHPTQLVYWKNHQSLAPLAQDLPAAIRSRDIVVGGRRGASCIVFDRVFINCLAVHGIQAAEVMLTPAQYTFGMVQGFWVGMFFLMNPTSWRATTVAAHGNAHAPDSWQSHWICAVQVGGGWTLYDPSYGVTVPWGGFALPGMIGGLIAIPAAYETAAVQHFPCVVPLLGVTVNLPSRSPLPPHLIGTMLWHN